MGCLGRRPRRRPLTRRWTLARTSTRAPLRLRTARAARFRGTRGARRCSAMRSSGLLRAAILTRGAPLPRAGSRARRRARVRRGFATSSLCRSCRSRRALLPAAAHPLPRRVVLLPAARAAAAEPFRGRLVPCSLFCVCCAGLDADEPDRSARVAAVGLCGGARAAGRAEPGAAEHAAGLVRSLPSPHRRRPLLALARPFRPARCAPQPVISL